MSDKQRNRIAQALMVPTPLEDPRTYYRTMDRINRDRDLGIELPTETAPIPRPDPRGQDFRGMQQHQQDIDTYNAITGNVPLPVPDPQRELQRRYEEIETNKRLTGER